MITKFVESGKCPVLPDGKIDFDAADEALAKNLDRARGGKGGGPNREIESAMPAPVAAVPRVAGPELPAPAPGTESFAFNRAQRERVEHQLKQLELDRQLGAVVEFAAFARGMEEAAAACRKECEGIVQRLPSLVAAEMDVRRCRELIEAEINRAMETLADNCMALADERRQATSQ